MNDSIPNAGLIAGVGLLLMAALSVLGVGFVLERLVTPGDAAQTAADIAASAGLFRLGVVSLFVVVALDMLVAWALYRVLQPVSNRLSALAAAFRLVYAGVFTVAIGILAVREIGTFYDVWDAGLVLFGLHLLLVGSLAYRSGYIPRLVGAVVAVSGFGYVFDSAARVLVAGSLPELTVLTGAGELVLALWLVFRSRRLAPHLPQRSGRSHGQSVSSQADTASASGTSRSPRSARTHDWTVTS